MSDQPKNQEQVQNLSDDDLENVAGGNAPDLTIAQGQNKVFDATKHEKLGTVEAKAGGTVTFSQSTSHCQAPDIVGLFCVYSPNAITRSLNPIHLQQGTSNNWDLPAIERH